MKGRSYAFKVVKKKIIFIFINLKKFMRLGLEIIFWYMCFVLFIFITNNNESYLIVLPPVHLHVVLDTIKAFCTLWDEMFYSLLISVYDQSDHPSCHIASTSRSCSNLWPSRTCFSDGNRWKSVGDELLWYNHNHCRFLS